LPIWMSLKMDQLVESNLKDMYFETARGTMSPMKDIPLLNVEQLGAAIRLKRKEQGLSQSALAAKLGVERKWILRLEAGNRTAELGLVLQALETLGIEVHLSDQAASGIGARTAPASQLDEVFRRLQRTVRK
jgi:HTH-type transcriptional regulator / antitoxin HipB